MVMGVGVKAKGMLEESELNADPKEFLKDHASEVISNPATNRKPCGLPRPYPSLR